MKTAVFNFSKPSITGTIASNRIAHFLAKTVNAPLIWDESIDNGKLDVLFLINGSFQFCKCLAAISSAILKADRIVWIQNDYNILPPKSVSNAESNFRKAFVTRRLKGKPDMIFWSTVRATADEYINWNSLTYEPLPSNERAMLRKKASKDLLYYGAFRQNRAALFDRYFTDCPVPVTISSGADGFAKYASSAQIIPAIPRAEFYHVLASHGLGLYVEDKKSSIEFHSPANRFYEMLSAGLPMIFQPEAVQMMQVAGFDVTPYVIHTLQDIARFMRKRDDIAHAQRAEWHTHYASKLRIAVRSAYNRLEQSA